MATARPWYEVLGVSPLASDDEIRAAYLRLVRAWHPDRFGHDPVAAVAGEERLKEINTAYELVRDAPRDARADLFDSAAPARAAWTPMPAEHSPALRFSPHGVMVRVVALLLALVVLLGALLGNVTALVGPPVLRSRPRAVTP